MPDDRLYDVAVVGAGPVGQALSLLVAAPDRPGRPNRTVLLVERWPQPYPRPRAVHFDDEAGRILQACGIGDELGRISEPAEIYEWRSAAGQTLLRFGRVGPGPSGWPQSSMFNQPALEAALGQRIGQVSAIEMRRGAEATGLSEHDDHVTLRLTNSDGLDSEVKARYVVGCDGANSTVRGLVDLPLVDLGFFYDWLIVDVVLGSPRTFDPINVQICDPARPTTVVSGGPGRRRWEFMRLPDETLAELNLEPTAWRLLRPLDVTPDNARLERHAVYTFQARYAERWRSGRVLIAGDAAHQMPPFAGQGLCAGLGDAANLAWKLDLALDEHAEAGLDAYQVERMDPVRSVIEFSVELGKVICVSDPAEASGRDELMAGAVVDGELSDVPPPPGLGAGLIHSTSAHAGELWIQGRVLAGSMPVRFDDALGAGWRLVELDGTGPSAELDDDLAAWFARIGGERVTIAVTDGADGLFDVDGTYTAWFSMRQVAVVLQRPDFRLYGTGRARADGAALVRHLRATLTGIDPAQ